MWTAKADDSSRGDERGFFPPVSRRPPAPAKRIDRGTDQQETLWDHLGKGTSNVLVEARAGSGKSASCREGMFRMLDAAPGLRVRYAVFNKTAADEFRDSCPSQAEVGTVHAFGSQALKRAFGSMIEKNKTYLILDETREGKALPRYMRKSVSLLVSAAKNQGLAPSMDKPGSGLPARLRELMAYFDVNAYGRPHWIVEHADRVLSRSAEWVQVIDFDDMIWLPSLHGVSFPECDALFLDEVQDWNPAQHALIPLMCRSGRVIAVGDPYQAIYVWRGADPDSMPRLGKTLEVSPAGLERFPLTITFRCPQSHVRLAQRYVPDFTAWEKNGEGVLTYVEPEVFSPPEQPGDLVICPLNGPVISAALKLLARRRRVVVKGRAVGDQLIAVLRLCGEQRTVAGVSLAVQRWKGRELSRLQDLDGADDLIESVSDRAAGLEAVASSCDSPAEIEPAINHLFAEEFRSDAVNFSTIHRAKGAEADRVFLLDVPTRKPTLDFEFDQARNLAYVARTRGKHELTIVTENHPDTDTKE